MLEGSNRTRIFAQESAELPLPTKEVEEIMAHFAPHVLIALRAIQAVQRTSQKINDIMPQLSIFHYVIASGMIIGFVRFPRLGPLLKTLPFFLLATLFVECATPF